MSSRNTKKVKATKKASPGANQWEGEWGYDEYGQCYRWVINAKGEQVTELAPPNNASETIPQDVPKSYAAGNPSDSGTGDATEQLVDGVNGLGINEDQGYASGQNYTYEYAPEDTDAHDRKGKSKEQYPQQQYPSGEPAARASKEVSGAAAYEELNQTNRQHTDEPFFDSEADQVNGDPTQLDEGDVRHPGGYPQPAVGTSLGDYGDEAEVAAAMAATRPHRASELNQGQSSTHRGSHGSNQHTGQSYYAYAQAQTTGYTYGDQQSSAYEESNAYEPEGDDDVSAADQGEEEDTVSPALPVITGTKGDYETIDPRFRVLHSSYWQPGTVFKILWADPLGSSARAKSNATAFTDHLKAHDNDGKLFYVKIRRFIIYGTGEGQSTCVPVYSYNNQGCKKKGVKAENHGIVHQYGKPAEMLRGEPRLGFGPAAIVLTDATEKITKESRIDYSNLLTVQHNVKILIIGHIHEESFETITSAVNDCWKKLHTNYGVAPKHQAKKASKRHSHR